jgi:hypothetical protein
MCGCCTTKEDPAQTSAEWKLIIFKMMIVEVPLSTNAPTPCKAVDVAVGM